MEYQTRSYSIDLNTGEMKDSKGTPKDPGLSDREMPLFLFLCENAGNLKTRQDIVSYLEEHGHYAGTTKFWVYQNIERIKRKVGDTFGDHHIHNVDKHGFMVDNSSTGYTPKKWNDRGSTLLSGLVAIGIISYFTTGGFQELPSFDLNR